MTISMQQLADRMGGVSQRSYETRTEDERDYARIVHSAAFRRLQGKTQTLGVAESDFPRTRLTHSLEVARIGSGIVQALRRRLAGHGPALGLGEGQRADVAALLPSDQQIQCICLAHDIGHPPFGHGGEMALNFHMREHGGFEGNGQTLRILGRLESYSQQHGMNLTRRSLLGVLKYPAPYSKVVNQQPLNPGVALTELRAGLLKPPKCYLDSEADIVAWLLSPFAGDDRERLQSIVAGAEGEHAKPCHKGFDTALMELADDISYGVHDLEDATSLDLVRPQDWAASMARADNLPAWFDQDRLGKLFFGEPYQRKEAIGEIVHRLILSIVLVEDEAFQHPMLRWQASLPPAERCLLRSLHGMVVSRVIGLPGTQMLEFKGQRIVGDLFSVYASDPMRFLPETARRQHAEAPDAEAAIRVVCDHVASLTDEQAARQFQKLFMPKMGSVFDVM